MICLFVVDGWKPPQPPWRWWNSRQWLVFFLSFLAVGFSYWWDGSRGVAQCVTGFLVALWLLERSD
jgi:hypothetical protein